MSFERGVAAKRFTCEYLASWCCCVIRCAVHLRACVRACSWVNGARLDSATGKGVAGLEAEDVKLNGLIDDLEAEDVAMDGRVSTVEDFLSAMSPATGNVNQGTQSQLNTTGAEYMTVSGGSLNVAETRCVGACVCALLCCVMHCVFGCAAVQHKQVVSVRSLERKCELHHRFGFQR